MHLVRDSASVRITGCKDPFVLDFAQASKDLRTGLTTVYDQSAASHLAVAIYVNFVGSCCLTFDTEKST